MSTALAIHAFEPGTTSQALEMSKILVMSRLLNKSIATPEAAFTIICAGRELGLTAMQSLRSIHIIEGKPTMSSDLMLALVKRSEVCKWFRLVATTAEVATYETLRVDEPEPTRMSFTIAEAREAGLLSKENWKKYTPAMLRARCIAALARAVYPDVMLGVYEDDELSVGTRPEPPVVTQVVSAQPIPEESAAFDSLMAAICNATTTQELMTAGKVIRELVKSGRVTPDERARLGLAYEGRKVELKGASGPDVTTSASNGIPHEVST